MMCLIHVGYVVVHNTRLNFHDCNHRFIGVLTAKLARIEQHTFVVPAIIFTPVDRLKIQSKVFGFPDSLKYYYVELS